MLLQFYRPGLLGNDSTSTYSPWHYVNLNDSMIVGNNSFVQQIIDSVINSIKLGQDSIKEDKT